MFELASDTAQQQLNREIPAASFKRILVAVDESTFSAHAAAVAIELVKALNAELAFFHAIDPARLAGAESGIAADVLAAAAERDGRALLDAFRERAATAPAALGFLEFGKPAAKLVESARNWPADLIVMGTHRRGTVEKLFVGSVAEGVLRHAPCPVLVVPVTR